MSFAYQAIALVTSILGTVAMNDGNYRRAGDLVVLLFVSSVFYLGNKISEAIKAKKE